jgi:hypothetical protein
MTINGNQKKKRDRENVTVKDEPEDSGALT